MSSFDFDAEPFAQGRFRLAYKGVFTAPPEKQGDKIVVKMMKDTCTWNRSDWNETENTVKISKELAAGFNMYSGTNRPVKFATVLVGYVTRVGNCRRAQLNECIAYEEYIPGDYIKWTNNYGAIDHRSTSMPAFMHWSWAHTNGETMIADLQGVKRDDAYYLTDPCLLSATHGGKYGCTDMGVEGMAMFFLNHECTNFCRSIPKPTVHGISKQEIAAALRTQQQISTSTAYSHELSFPRDIREKLIPIFKRIATSANV